MCPFPLLPVRIVSTALCLVLLALPLSAAEPAPDGQRAAAKKNLDDGNYSDAYQLYRKLALDPRATQLQVGNDLQGAIDSLRRLGRPEQLDDLREWAVSVHPSNWRALAVAAQSYLGDEHTGAIVAGKFERSSRGNTDGVNSYERDRVRSLQLFEEARKKLADEADRAAIARFYLDYANALLRGTGYHKAWRLQSLTDLNELPDYEQYYFTYRDEPLGAPVDAAGNPVYYQLPKSYPDANSDGQRWRWLLVQAAVTDPAQAHESRSELANFLLEQFGVQTLENYGGMFGAGTDESKQRGGIFALHTLADNETIAHLATGIKRFTLPAEFDYIRIYRQISAEASGKVAEQALHTLATTYTNRQQYGRAAEFLRQSIERFGPSAEKQQALDQIVKNWGEFEPVAEQPAGAGAIVDFRFRNGTRVEFEAHEIKFAKLLDDVKNYLKSDPQPVDERKASFENLGYRLVDQNQTEYLGEKVAAWGLDLVPRPDHFDRRVRVTTPLQKPGAYLLVGKMAEGNASRVIVWVSDTVIVKKSLAAREFYYVADSVSGKPLPQAKLEFFGWQSEHGRGRTSGLVTKSIAATTDENGQSLIASTEFSLGYGQQWVAVARTETGRFASLGLERFWHGSRYWNDWRDDERRREKVFAITDRPVYRPGQTVKYKFWIRRAQYADDRNTELANREFRMRISDSERELEKKAFTTDAYGGFEGEFVLKKNARLGRYSLWLDNKENQGVSGGEEFRVEEYKKPEFEVLVEAPREPVMLGDKFTATVEAKYYFGAPVADARVKYKVLRGSHEARWYPRGTWDWLYGPGYWWFAADADWYPNWRNWGCPRPAANTSWYGTGILEVVAAGEVPIGKDGKVEIQVDTAIAKELHGNQDHNYTISAEVVDRSRRTITGTGNVLAAREPFQVLVWLDRGYYRTGEAIEAGLAANSLDRQPIVGKGELTLFKVAYNEKLEPIETPLETWSVDTNQEGAARQRLNAGLPGQYRLSYKLTDARNRTHEGGTLFVVRGDNFNGEEFRFSDLELITDKREYAPGETVKLMVNTNRRDGTVLLFMRPTEKSDDPPKTIQLTGKSTIEEIGVVQADMPNFFIEALSVSRGAVFSEVRDVVVPPAGRILSVAVEPSAADYRPGADAKVKLKVSDLAGKPFLGSVALTVYDKSVEYISRGTNVPEIRDFFWKWRRSYSIHTESSLKATSPNLLQPREIGMQDLGIFGHTNADEVDWDRVVASPPNRGERPRPVLFAKSEVPLRSLAPPSPNRDDQAASGPINPAFNLVFDDAAAPSGMVEPSVRTNFADTAYWNGTLSTDKQGIAEVAFTMPESLTTWKIKAWAMGARTEVGEAETTVVTSKNLLVRLQAPRFFVETDEVVVSANVHNYLKTDKVAAVSLELEGNTLEPLTSVTQNVSIPAGGEARVDWRVRATGEGEALVRMKALTDEESDAMEQRFPVSVHGMLRMESYAGALRPRDNSAHIDVTVPAERRPGDSRLELRYSPSLAGAMVDALPYLINCSYESTDATLNRFLPTVIAQNILLRMNLDLKAIQEKRTNLNAQELGDDRARAEGWRRYKENPVFNPDEVRELAQKGLTTLSNMQVADGGWGWFSGWGERSTPHVTAQVVHGLQLARLNKLRLPQHMLERGVNWLKQYQAEQIRQIKHAPQRVNPWKSSADNLDAFVYMVLADSDEADPEMLDFLYRDRTKLTVYGLGLFGLALHKQGEAKKLAMVLRNIDQFLEQDEENQTAYLKLPENSWWHWYGSDIEADACYLKLLAKTDPQNVKAARLVKYLLNHRKHATYWNSTRDTALCVEALAEYFVASGESRPDMVVEISIDGRKQKEVKIDAANLFTFDNKLVLEGDAVTTGGHRIELTKRGTGPLYFNAYLTTFTLEKFIPGAGLELKVGRKFYKLVEQDRSTEAAGARGQVVSQKVEKYRREEIPNLGVLKSGDLVEIELELDSKNDYEYLMFEDMKAAGFEPVELQSGYNGNDLGAYMELRDERVAFFARTLSRGKHSVSYRLRAEIPGRFSALPARGSAVYAPELKGNSDEMKLSIQE